jgi:uncharacterized protein involved in exopolysaccharide biosynthesis
MANDGMIATPGETTEPSIGLFELLAPLRQRWKLWIFGSLGVGLLALGIAFLLPLTYTARTSFLPPQQQQSSIANALSSLGSLAGLVGAAASIKSPADQYVALMRSDTALDRLVDRFELMKVYEAEYRFQARNMLNSSTRMEIGKKDGLISIEVDDGDPKRAAEIANAYVEELRRMTSVLAVSEAQQRRAFFDKELQDARDQLTKAQKELQATGFNIGALRAEPRAAAEGYARLKAEITSAEIRLRMLRGVLADTAPDVQQQLAGLNEMRSQLSRMEQAADTVVGQDYIAKYREFKYRETLFELFAQQYEIARIDESREGALIQVVDLASTPEYKSGPKRGLIAVVATLVALLLLGTYILVSFFWRQSPHNPRNAHTPA